MVAALTATLRHDAQHVPLINGAVLGAPDAQQLAGQLQRAAQAMQQLGPPLDALLGPHAAEAAAAAGADVPPRGPDQEEGGAAAEAAAANLRDDRSVVTTRRLVEGLVEVVGANCEVLGDVAYQMGQLSDLEVQAASMQALLVQLRQQQGAAAPQ